jgi:hypothetical protein
MPIVQLKFITDNGCGCGRVVVVVQFGNNIVLINKTI